MAELAWEVQYYAKISPQLGERFATVVERALAIATEFPDMGSPYKYGTRRVFPKRFPFSVVYLHRGRISAWGRPGQGAQFRVTLPRKHGEDVDLGPSHDVEVAG